MSDPWGLIEKWTVAVVSVIESTLTFWMTGGPGRVLNDWTLRPRVEEVALSPAAR